MVYILTKMANTTDCVYSTLDFTTSKNRLLEQSKNDLHIPIAIQMTVQKTKFTNRGSVLDDESKREYFAHFVKVYPQKK